jgi:hypothetical protein
VAGVALLGLTGGVLVELARSLWPRLPVLMLSDQPQTRVMQQHPSFAPVPFLRTSFHHGDLTAAITPLLPPP